MILVAYVIYHRDGDIVVVGVDVCVVVADVVVGDGSDGVDNGGFVMVLLVVFVITLLMWS